MSDKPTEPIWESEFGVWTCPLCEMSANTAEELVDHLCSGGTHE